MENLQFATVFFIVIFITNIPLKEFYKEVSEWERQSKICEGERLMFVFLPPPPSCSLMGSQLATILR